MWNPRPLAKRQEVTEQNEKKWGKLRGVVLRETSNDLANRVPVRQYLSSDA
jgi:hypothetical protein